MKAITEKQILEWKEELNRQIQTKNQAEKVLNESINNIKGLQGGIQFGESLLQKNESENRLLNTEGTNQQSTKAPSKK